MPAAFALALCLAAAPIKIASPGLHAVRVDRELTTFYSDHLAQQLHQAAPDAIQAISATEIASLLGFERQKALLGCAEASGSCMAELGNALGVDGLLVGSMARFGEAFQINVKVVDPRDGHTLSAYSGEAEGEKGVLAELKRAAQRMAPEVLAKVRRAPSNPTTVSEPPPPPPKPAMRESTAPPKQAPRPPPPQPKPPAVVAVAPPQPAATPISAPQPPSVSRSRPIRWDVWAPAGGAAVAAVVGAVLLAEAKSDFDLLSTVPPAHGSWMSPAQAATVRDQGQLFQALGLVAEGVAAGALGFAGYRLFFSHSAADVALVPMPNGATFVLSGRFQ